MSSFFTHTDLKDDGIAVMTGEKNHNNDKMMRSWYMEETMKRDKHSDTIY